MTAADPAIGAADFVRLSFHVQEISVNDDSPVSAACRVSGRDCYYVVAGDEAFVRSNYKQHLRESHLLAHPVVLDDELCRRVVVAPGADAAPAGAA